MARPTDTSIVTLVSLVGVSVADLNCVLTADDLVQLGGLLIKQCPADVPTICFLGGALSDLTAGAQPAQQIVPLYGELGDEPFLVIGGRGGGLALLATEEAGNYRARIFSDADTLDRVLLVLSQFGTYTYRFDTITDRVVQRGFIVSVIAALLANPAFRAINLGALLPTDQHWIALADILRTHAHNPASLMLPAVRQLLQESGCARVLVGQLDAAQQRLWIIASLGRLAPESLPAQQGILADVLRNRQFVSTPPAAYLGGKAALEQDGGWANGDALTVLPLIRNRSVWGMLLATSDRPLTGVARANLQGLGVLLATYLDDEPYRVPEVEARAVNEPARALETHGNGHTPPAARPLLPGPPAESAAAVQVSQPRHASAMDEGGPLEPLRAGLLLVDAQGCIVAISQAATWHTGLSEQLVGTQLAESSAWMLAPMLAEAIAGVGLTREVELLPGYLARVEIRAMGPTLWAFLFHRSEAAPSAPPGVPAGEGLSPDGESAGEFLPNFSSIIRGPLQELRTLVTSVPAAGRLNEEQSRLLGQIVKQNTDLTLLVSDLLSLGQEPPQSHGSSVPVRLDLLVESVVGMLYAESGRRGQEVTIHIQPHVPCVPGDEEGLGRVVSILLDNAIKYSPAGAEIRVTVVQEGPGIVVAIHDTGIGLPDGELQRVFDPFYRAPSTDQLGVLGRGLGLTIAKAIIERHGGRIWATSEPGRGSTFAFLVPCGADGARAAA